MAEEERIRKEKEDKEKAEAALREKIAQEQKHKQQVLAMQKEAKE